MPSYLCKCLTRIDYTEIPASSSYHLVADAAAQVDEDLITYNATWTESTEVLRCPSCHRLWVFWDGMGQAPSEYLLVGVDDREPWGDSG